jgi:hypothetical protein
MTKAILASALSLVAAVGISVAPAQAENGRNAAFGAGAAAGIIGGALLGSALSSGPVYAPAPVYEEPAYVPCHWVRRWVPNTYDPGYHWERVQVCE